MALGSLLGGSRDLVRGITMFSMWVIGVTNLLTKSPDPPSRVHEAWSFGFSFPNVSGVGAWGSSSLGPRPRVHQ